MVRVAGAERRDRLGKLRVQADKAAARSERLSPGSLEAMLARTHEDQVCMTLWLVAVACGSRSHAPMHRCASL